MVLLAEIWDKLVFCARNPEPEETNEAIFLEQRDREQWQFCTLSALDTVEFICSHTIPIPKTQT